MKKSNSGVYVPFSEGIAYGFAMAAALKRPVTAIMSNGGRNHVYICSYVL